MSEKYNILSIEVEYDPEANLFHTTTKSNDALPCREFLEIIFTLAAEVQKSKFKTMGEFLESRQK